MKYKLLMQIVGVTDEKDFIELDSENVTIDSITLKFREASLRPWRFTDANGVINLFPLDSKSIVRVLAIPVVNTKLEVPKPESRPEPKPEPRPEPQVKRNRNQRQSKNAMNDF